MDNQNNLHLKFFLAFIVIATVLSFTSFNEAFGAHTVEWRNELGASIASADFDSGNLLGPSPRVVIFVDDPLLVNANPNDEISVTITTNKETLVITLPEVGGDTGEFESEVVFMHDNYRFNLDDEVIVTVDDPTCGAPFGACTGIPDELDSTIGAFPFLTGVSVTSDTQGPFGLIGLLLTETGDVTTTFEQTLLFSDTVNDESIATLRVSEGDILSFVDDISQAKVIAQIVPTVPGKAAVIAEDSTTITASYDNGVDGVQQDDLDITESFPPGRGGGGLVRPGLVVDSPPAPRLDGGGGDRSAPPTFGINKNNQQVIDYGFFHNSDKYTITDKFWTPFEKVQINVGVPQSFGMKALGSHPISRVEFGLVPEVGMMHQAEVLMEIWVKPGEERIVIKQSENIIDQTTISPEITIKDEDCIEGTGKLDCVFIGISNVIFREEPFFEVVGLKVSDIKGRASTVYLNDGFDIHGRSMNPAKTDIIDSGKKGVGLITVTQIDKWKNIWEDEDGIQYFKNEFGTYIRQTPINLESTQDEYWTVMNRINNNFEKLIDYEQMRASKIFDSKKIISELPEPFSYEKPNYADRFLDENFVKLMKTQEEFAMQYWDGAEIKGKLRDSFTHKYPDN